MRMVGMESGTHHSTGRFRERTLSDTYPFPGALGVAVGDELHVDVAPGGVGVGAGAVRVGDELFGGGLAECGDMDIEDNGEGKAVVALGGADGDFGVDGDVAGFQLLLHSLILHSADEAGGVAGGKELFRVGAGLAAAAERPRGGEIQVDTAIGTADMAVSAIFGGHFCGVERLNEGEHGSMCLMGVCRGLSAAGSVLVRFA